jgi:hypothetical protein
MSEALGAATVTTNIGLVRDRQHQIDSTQEDEVELTRIISVDDHIVEPRDLWVKRLGRKYRDRAPRVERVRGHRVNHGAANVEVI